jgi:hypothetical protein
VKSKKLSSRRRNCRRFLKGSEGFLRFFNGRRSGGRPGEVNSLSGIILYFHKIGFFHLLMGLCLI